MNTIQNLSDSLEPETQKLGSALTIMVVHDNVPPESTSFNVLGTLVGRCSEVGNVNGYFLPYQELADPVVAVTARELAARAELIVMAVRCDRDLPEFVREFLGASISEKKLNSGGLVVLLEFTANHAHTTARLRAYFQRLAESKLLDLFLHEF